jgi:hypothetical protein
MGHLVLSTMLVEAKRIANSHRSDEESFEDLPDAERLAVFDAEKLACNK